MKKEKIYLAGGCFWGTEHYMKTVPGVISTRVGYALGDGMWEKTLPTENINYNTVCRGIGYAETVEVEFDADAVSLMDILTEYGYTIDPTIEDQQGADRGVQYRTGIFYTDPAHKEIVTEFLDELQKSYRDPVVTENRPLLAFVEAEDYHQKYLDKNPGGYCHISFSSIAEKKKNLKR